MKTKLFLFPVALALVSLSACSTRAVYDGAGAAAGGVIGNQVSNGNPAWTAAGAAAGVVGAELLQQQAEGGRREQYNAGYDRGASDTAKRTYWLAQNLQRPDAEKSLPRKRLYTFPAPPATDGVNQQPYDVTVSVEE